MNEQQAINVFAQLIEHVNAGGFFKRLVDLDTARTALEVLQESVKAGKKE